MSLHVSEAKYLHDYVIWLKFSGGAEGEIDLRNEISGEVFAPLQDLNEFKRFHVDPELQTIAWENGADLAPGFLYGQMNVLAWLVKAESVPKSLFLLGSSCRMFCLSPFNSPVV